MNTTRSMTDWPPEGSDMAPVIRATAWHTTPLGAIDKWSASLRTAVTTALDSPLPTIVLWGPQLIQIYNDAYSHVLSLRHPKAMGQPTEECWPEVWYFNEPIYQRVMGDGERVHLEDQEYVIEPSGVREVRYFTVTYAPARDEHGVVCGVFVVAMDTTRRVIAERDNAILLRQSHFAVQQMRQMFDHAPSFMALLEGPNYVVKIANEACLQLVGRRDIVGKSVASAVPEVEQQGFMKMLDEAYATGNRFVATSMPIYLPDTDTGVPVQRFLNFVYQPIRNAEGQVDAVFVEGNDVTAEHKANCELAKLNAELEEKVQHVEKARRRQNFQLTLADTLRTASIHEGVAAACALLGHFLGVARVVFCDVDDSSNEFWIRSEWRRSGLPTVTGEVRRLDDFGADNIASLRRGEVFSCDDIATDPRTAAFAEAYAMVDLAACLAIPLVRNGQLTIILNLHQTAPYHWTDDDIELARDMAERTWSAAESARAQLELRQERDQSQAIFNNMTEGFGMIDRDWRVVHMNSEGLRLGQRTAAEVIGKNHWEVWPEVRGTEVEAVYNRVRHTGKAESFEQLVRLRDHVDVWLEVRVHRALGGELAIFYHEISDRKAVENALTEVARQKDEFLAMLGHELRNPLAPICAATELLTVDTPDRTRVRQIGEVIKRQSAHMTSLIQDLLDVSRVTQGLVTLQSCALDLKNVINDAVEQVRPLIEARRHLLSIKLPMEAVWVFGDKERLVQILANLLVNAAKYTNEDGHIEVVLQATTTTSILSVSDDGVGMSPALAERAFDLFSQAERDSDRVMGGLGIGLALVKRLVELHGGTVAIRSSVPGHGSKFTVTLPRLDSNPAADAASILYASQVASPLRIMVVDDNVDGANMLAMFLEGDGHQVTVDYSAAAALQRAPHVSPHVCLLDVGLPDMDGKALVRRLVLLPSMRDSVFVAITGYNQPADRESALASGFHHHFAKPVDIEKLVSVLNAIGSAV